MCFQFVLYLLQSTNTNKKITSIASERFEMIFKFIVEEDEIDHTIINTSGDEQPIDVAKIITPEAV